jgi:hypothetical protein
MRYLSLHMNDQIKSHKRNFHVKFNCTVQMNETFSPNSWWVIEAEISRRIKYIKKIYKLI